MDLLSKCHHHCQMILNVSLPIFCSPRSPKEDVKKISGCSCYCFSLIIILAQIFLHGVLALTLYWIFQFHWDGQGLPFAWSGAEGLDLGRLWNLHPVLMVTGFIYCMGQGILMEGLVPYYSEYIQQYLCIGHAAAAARFAASSCTSCSTCWASPAWCWASLPSGCGKTMKAILTCTAFTPGLGLSLWGWLCFR